MPDRHQPDTTQHSPGGVTDSSATPPWVEVTLAMLVAGIGTWVWFEARAFPDADEPARDPAVLPLVIAVVLWACALILLLQLGLRWIRSSGSTGQDSEMRDSPPEEPTQQNEERDDTSRIGLRQLGIVALFVGALVLYIWAAFEAGYLVATSVFLTAATCALSGRVTPRSIALTAAIAAVCAVSIWLIFVYGLDVRLPETWAP